jgi:hypothetical protein
LLDEVPDPFGCTLIGLTLMVGRAVGLALAAVMARWTVSFFTAAAGATTRTCELAVVEADGCDFAATTPTAAAVPVSSTALAVATDPMTMSRLILLPF